MIAENLNRIKATLHPGVKLVAVSKYHPVSELQEAYDAGQRIFGENLVQELVGKEAVLPKDIQWHYIGHLQTNKVKYIAPFVSLIHAVDSIKLLKEIDKQAHKVNRVIDCLLQLHIAVEETKFGLTLDELVSLVDSDEFKQLKNVRVVGLMAMATNTDDEAQVNNEFATVKGFFDKIHQTFFADAPYFTELSMGMSGDYLLAQEHGSTMVRVGSSIFGERDYSVRSY